MQITYTGISAKLRPNGILLIAEMPDQLEKKVFIDNADIREFYGCNPAKWLELYSEDEAMCYEMFELVNGIRIAD